MGPKSSASFALFLILNLLFFALTTSCGGGCPPKKRPRPPPRRLPPPFRNTPPPPPNVNTPPSSSIGRCPRDALKFGICIEVLNLINVTLGSPPVVPCCSLIEGLVDLEAAICLCTVLRANILGLRINLPIALSLLLNVCSRNVPPQFQCP